MNILLHVCCGPCSLTPVRDLRAMGHTVTGLFFNPNIQPLTEYLRRREAAQQAAERLEMPMIWLDRGYDFVAWLEMMRGRERLGPDASTPRCILCYDQRLEQSARLTAEQGFDAFSSSLLYSRHQLHEAIAQSGREAAARHNTVFFYHDFRPGWQDGIDRSKEWGLYRQNYCGCAFSEQERFAGKLKKLVGRG